MKSMWPPLVAIFFMTFLFYVQGRGAMAPRHPPLDPLLCQVLTFILLMKRA